MRHLSLSIVCAIIAWRVAVCAAAPVALVLEDFEGPLVGWPEEAVLTDDATQGAKALRWEPKPGDGPQFYYFDFRSRGVELVEWDRLVFDYKFEASGCVWWGVKIVDYPLGDGMQATWLIADANRIHPGKWQTAVVGLQHPMWLWGEKPSKTEQRIHFRCQMQKGKSSAILIDNIRLERDPVRIGKVEADEPERAGDDLVLTYRIPLTNTLDDPVRVRLLARDTSPGLRVSLADDEVTIPPAGARTASVRLSARMSGPKGFPPLTRLSTNLICRVKDMNVTDKTAQLALSIPLGQVPHPCLLITKDDVARVRRRVEESDDARAIYDGLKARADAWLERTPRFPDRGSQWWHWYTCKKCGARLRTESPTKHVCPDCGATYSGWPYDDVVLARDHSALSNAVRDLGLMYQFTGDRAYADKAREILLGYAERYLKYPLHNIRGEPKRGGGHVGPQTLDEATWLIPLTQGFDCIYETLSEEEVRTIADKMLLPAAELIHEHQWGIHNICCWHDSAYGLVGLTLGDERLASDAITGPKGFRAQIEKGVTDDGFWYESAWGYHFYTMSALQPLAIAARNVGINLYTERYKKMYDAPLSFMAPGGALPAFNDSGTANPLGQGRMYVVAYARWRDPRYLLPILRSGRRSLEALLFGLDLGQPKPFRLQSAVFPSAGYVILRSGELAETGADSHIPENYLALDYGPHGGGHGHPDKLGFVMYGKRALLAEDPGSIAYGNPAHGGWFRQTLSHNTILVNGKSQKPCTGTLQFAALGEGIGLCSARADEAYPGVRLRRTMALIGDRVVDVVVCEAEEDSTFDWAYHNRGTLESSLPFTKLDDPPDGDGYSWAKDWRAARANGAWRAIWRQEGGPSLLLVQAPGEGGCEVLSAVGMGNPTRVKVPFVVSRQRGKTAIYCTAMHTADGEPPSDLVVRTMRPEGDAAPGGERLLAVEVAQGAVRDVLLINPGGGVLRAGEFRLDGLGAALRFEGDRLTKMVAANGAEIYVGGRRLSPD